MGLQTTKNNLGNTLTSRMAEDGTKILSRRAGSSFDDAPKGRIRRSQRIKGAIWRGRGGHVGSILGYLEAFGALLLGFWEALGSDFGGSWGEVRTNLVQRLHVVKLDCKKQLVFRRPRGDKSLQLVACWSFRFGHGLANNKKQSW